MSVKTILIPGIFDVFNYGDIQHIQKIQKKYPNSEIILGVYNEMIPEIFEIPKLMTIDQRLENLQHSKLFSKVLYPLPLYLDETYLTEQNIDLVINYQIKPQHKTLQQIFSKLCDSKFVDIQANDITINAEELYLRVLSDLDRYVFRNLKRGFKRQEMDVSAFVEFRICFQQNIAKFFGNICDRRKKCSNQ